MTFQPGFAAVAALIGDPAREAMLVALSDGRALPAGELAAIAGISAQSASRHLQRMVGGGALTVWTQGRFRYYRISNSELVAAIESLCLIAQKQYGRAMGQRRTRLPPPDLCFARHCYDHLAGRLGVGLFTMLCDRGFLAIGPDQRDARLTESGLDWVTTNGIWNQNTMLSSALSIRLCMDWTERRPHISGPLASAILQHLLKKHLLRPFSNGGSRALRLTPNGRRWFAKNGITTIDDLK